MIAFGGPLGQDPVGYYDLRQAYSEWTARNSEVVLSGGWKLATNIARWTGTIALAIASGSASVAATADGWSLSVLTTGAMWAGVYGAVGAAGGAAYTAIKGDGDWSRIASATEFTMGMTGLVAGVGQKAIAEAAKQAVVTLWACRALSAGKGALQGAGFGAGFGALQAASDSYARYGTVDAGAVLNGAAWGAAFGGVGGGLHGLVNPTVCFVAGTQVVVGIEGQKIIELEAASTAISTKVTYRTKSIEEIAVGDLVLAKPQDDATFEPALFRVDRVYRRTTDHLRVLTIQSSNGIGQELKTTDEHPVFGGRVRQPVRLLCCRDAGGRRRRIRRVNGRR